MFTDSIGPKRYSAGSSLHTSSMRFWKDDGPILIPCGKTVQVKNPLPGTWKESQDCDTGSVIGIDQKALERS
jgi:hypothetical protein